MEKFFLYIYNVYDSIEITATTATKRF